MPKHTRAHSLPKILYRVKNWTEYDKALVQRGSIIFWMSDGFEKTWLHTGKKQRGSQFDYSDQAILGMLTVKEVFHLTNCGVEGFVRSLFGMMKINLPVPDHSTLSKRGKGLKINLPKKTSQRLNIVMDSAGLKIYGEGEWKVQMHGVSKPPPLDISRWQRWNPCRCTQITKGGWWMRCSTSKPHSSNDLCSAVYCLY